MFNLSPRLKKLCLQMVVTYMHLSWWILVNSRKRPRILGTGKYYWRNASLSADV